jgi:hypothetical protein
MRAVMSLTVFLWFNAVSVAIGQEAWPRAEPAELVGVINSWNVFGRKPPLVVPFIDALIEASSGS